MIWKTPTIVEICIGFEINASRVLSKSCVRRLAAGT
jgi:coenzyme PQQ precursor peptide PqqA